MLIAFMTWYSVEGARIKNVIELLACVRYLVMDVLGQLCDVRNVFQSYVCSLYTPLSLLNAFVMFFGCGPALCVSLLHNLARDTYT